MSADRLMPVAVGFLLVLAACRPAPGGVGPAGTGAEIRASNPRPLDDAHAGEFRRAFDEASDRARYVVALSPT